MNDPKNLPEWKKLGFSREILDAEHKWTPVNIGLWWRDPPPPSMEAELWTSNVLSSGCRVFSMGWMGYPFPEPPLNDWHEAGRRVVSASLYYFFGSWRNRFTWCQEDHNYQSSRGSLPWSDAYRAGLAFACAFSDWTAVDKLLQWPASDLRRDAGTDDRIDEDNAYQIWLAMRLRGEAEDQAGSQRGLAQRPVHREGDFSAIRAFQNVKDVLPNVDSITSAAIEREMIQRGARRRPKMLMAAADAMLAGNAVDFSKSLSAYLKHYRQKELQAQRVDTGICLDAMVLWHLARRRGLGDIPVPEDLLVMIARP